MELLFSELNKYIRMIFFEIKILFLHKISFFLVKFSSKKPKKLHLGCGEIKLKGFENIDQDSTEAVDKIFDLRRTLPYEDNSVEIIFSEHVFEHFLPYQLQQIFFESRRILKNRGKLLFSIPDFELLSLAFHDPNFSKKNLIEIYKKELEHFGVTYKNENTKVADDYYFDHLIHQFGEHKFFYTFDIIRFLLQEAKFKKIKRRVWIKGLDSPTRKYSSLMIEAIK